MWGDADPATHVAIGRAIWAQGRIPSTDPFLQGAPAFHDHEWLFDLGAAALWALGGPTLLMLAIAAVFAATAAELATLIARRAGGFAGTLALFLALACSPMHLQARPHIFTWAFLVFGRGMIDRRVPLWAWVVLGTAWANLHGGFMAGIGLLGVLGGWRVAAALALGSLANPRGPLLYLDVFTFLTNREVLSRTADFLPALPGVTGFETFVFVAVEIAVTVWFAHRFRWDAPAARDAAWAVGLIALAASSVRNVPLVALLVAPEIARWAQAVVDRQQGGLAEAIPKVEARMERLRVVMPGVLAAAIVAVLARLPGSSEAAGVPIAGLRAVPPGAVVSATFHWGGWAALFRPDLQVVTHPLTADYADAGGRMTEYLLVGSAGPGWEEALAARGVTAAWLDPAMPLAPALEAKGWGVAFRDPLSVVLTRP